MSTTRELRFYLRSKSTSLWHYAASETLQALLGWIPGIVGIGLRAVAYGWRVEDGPSNIGSSTSTLPVISLTHAANAFQCAVNSSPMVPQGPQTGVYSYTRVRRLPSGR